MRSKPDRLLENIWPRGESRTTKAALSVNRLCDVCSFAGSSSSSSSSASIASIRQTLLSTPENVNVQCSLRTTLRPQYTLHQAYLSASSPGEKKRTQELPLKNSAAKTERHGWVCHATKRMGRYGLACWHCGRDVTRRLSCHVGGRVFLVSCYNRTLCEMQPSLAEKRWAHIDINTQSGRAAANKPEKNLRRVV